MSSDPAHAQAAGVSPVGAPVVPDTSRRPLAITEVRFAESSFWGSRQQTNAGEILPTCYRWMTRLGWIDNLTAAADGRLPGARRGREFTDSDVYKLLEAMLWEQGRRPTPDLAGRIDELVTAIAGAQEPDGYLNTMFGRPGQAPRYSDLEWGHELYDYGHLLQAAVAEIRTVGPARLTHVARRVADHICEAFGPQGIRGICGHPGVELALIEFGRAVGEPRYRHQARIFLERRGHRSLSASTVGLEYFLDDIPIQEADVLRGHAVRAVYLSAAATDLAIDDADERLLEAVRRQWDRTIACRTYLTGGMGSRHEDESFGADYELPSEHAYSETCAAVGALMWSWRLLLATGDSRYADVAERMLYNVIATSPSEDGSRLFYANTLHQRELSREPVADEPSSRASSSMRAPWFDVSCCPPNVARVFATVASYVGFIDDDGVSITTFASMDIDAELSDGGRAQLTMRTGYPHDGRIVLSVAKSRRPWDLTLRIPEWAAGATLARGGHHTVVPLGWARVPSVGGEQEELELILPMAARRTLGDPRIDSARGAMAVERGPLVYCLESSDLPDGLHVDDVVAMDGIAESDGVPNIRVRRQTAEARPWPYGDSALSPGEEFDAPLIPYHRWGARGPSTMRVWIRTV